jgi:hypothetical protein
MADVKSSESSQDRIYSLEELKATVMYKPGCHKIDPMFCAEQIARVVRGEENQCSSQDKEAAQDALIEIALNCSRSSGVSCIAERCLREVAKNDPAFETKLLGEGLWYILLNLRSE